MLIQGHLELTSQLIKRQNQCSLLESKPEQFTTHCVLREELIKACMYVQLKQEALLSNPLFLQSQM
jgi:hypothetical protein